MTNRDRPQEKYELEFVAAANFNEESVALVSILTGYDLSELRQRLAPRLIKNGSWYGRDFGNTFRLLGFDCSPRFQLFAENTPYPCLMRYHWTNEKGKKSWSVDVYYDGLVYSPQEGIYPLAEWRRVYAHCKITSMMQVWIKVC